MSLTQIYQGESIGITLHSELPLDDWSVMAELFTSAADYRIVGACPDREGFLSIENEGQTLKMQIPPAECAKLSEGILSLHITLARDHAVKKGTIRLAEILSARAVAAQRMSVEQQLVFMDNDIQLSLNMGPKISDDGHSAYEIAVQNGFEGTEAEWLAALPGEDGHTPYVGPNGNWWIDGQDTGKPSRGPVPVKGIDYFTEEELAQIAAEAAGQVPPVDVAGPIAEHNASGSAHGDLRELLRGAVGLPVYDPASYALTFTTQSGATMVVDLPLEVMGLDYDPATKEMIYTAADGTKRRIPLAEFVDIYVGSVGAEIQIAVDAGNVIRARLLAGSVAMEHLSASLQAEIRAKVNAIPGKGLSTNDYTDEDRDAVASIPSKADADKTYTMVVDTPIWTTQPTIDGVLDGAFVAYPEDFYFVTLKAADGTALPAGQFRLTPALDALYNADHTQAIDQTFTLAGLDTGNSGRLAESTPVDFTEIGDGWRLRNGGISGIWFDTDPGLRKDYDLTIVASIKPTRIYYGYYTIFYPYAELNYRTLSCVGNGYYANAPGFLFPPHTYTYRKHNFSIETCHFRRLPTSWVADYTRGIYAYNGSLNNRIDLLNNPAATVRVNGYCFSTNPAKKVSDLGLGNYVQYNSQGSVLLNGSSVRLTFIKRQ